MHRLLHRRNTTGTGSRLPTALMTSKHVTSGTTRETTTTNNNNNSPPSDSPAHLSTLGTPCSDLSRDSSDVTPDQSARVRPSPSGKRPRKLMSAGGRGARPVPGHGEMVDSAGQPRCGPPVAGKLSVSATNSPVSLAAVGTAASAGNNSPRKQTCLLYTSPSPRD